MNRIIAAALPMFMLGACNLAPTYVRPETPVPASWPSGDAYVQAAAAGEPAGLPWTQLVSDPRLKAVIESALANNRDLRVALANILSARAQYRVERSALFPTVNASSGLTATRTSGVRQDQYAAEVGITAFEVDLFGRVKNLSRAALETYLATEEGARSTRITLIAETATAYATLAADQELLALAKQTVSSAERSLALTQSLNRAGLAGKLDVRQAETVLEQARSDVASSTTQVAQDRNALDLLAGAPVEEALLPQSLQSLAQGVGQVPAGLSSSVLLNRPDVLQAEHMLKAANADIGAARAAMFPTISLTGAIGVASSALSSLFTGDAFTWTAAPSASLPIFGGAARGNLKYSEAQRDVYVAQYEKAIQTAFQEVADGLARAGTIDAQQAAQHALVIASQQSYDLADQRYRAGIDTFLNALDSQRTLYAARKTAISTDLTAISNRIYLYRVIGAD